MIGNRYDIAVEVGERKDINVVNRILAPTRFHVVASPDYLQRFAAPKHPDDLKHHLCLLFSGSEGIFSVTPKCGWRCNSGHGLRAGAKQGLGLAYLPDYYLKEDLAQGKLIKVMNDWQSADRNLVKIYQHRRHVSSKIRLFTEFMRETFCKEIPLMSA